MSTHAAEPVNSERVRSRVGLLGFLAVAPVVAAATCSLATRVALRAGLSLDVSIGVSAIAIATLAVVSFGLRGLRDLVPVRPPRVEFIVVVILLIMLVVLWDRAADRTLMWPHLVTSDAAQHAALVRWIADTGRLPEPGPRLGGLATYPVGAHLIAAVLTALSGQTPISGMWWTAIGAAVSQLLAIAWLTRMCSRTRSYAGIGVAVILWLGAWRFGISAVTGQFFFAQVVAVSFSLVGVGLVVLGATGLEVRKWVPATLVLLVATVFTYPQNAVVIPGALGALALVRTVPRLRGLSNPGRLRALLGSVALLVVVGGVILRKGSGSPYLTRQALYGSGEGAVPPLSVAAVGGLLAVALFVAGTIEIIARCRRGDRGALVLSAALAAPATVLAGLATLRWVGEPVTAYRITKNFYVILPLLCVAAGVAVVATQIELTSVLRRRSGPVPVITGTSARRPSGAPSWVAVGLLLISLGVALRPDPLLWVSEPLVNQDAYKLGTYAANKYDVRDIGVAGEGISPYVLWVVLFHENTLDPADQLPQRLTVWDDWPNGRRNERYLLVDASVAGRFAAKPGVKVIARRGGALLLERSRAERPRTTDVTGPTPANS